MRLLLRSQPAQLCCLSSPKDSLPINIQPQAQVLVLQARLGPISDSSLGQRHAWHPAGPVSHRAVFTVALWPISGSSPWQGYTWHPAATVSHRAVFTQRPVASVAAVRGSATPGILLPLFLKKLSSHNGPWLPHQWQQPLAAPAGPVSHRAVLTLCLLPSVAVSVAVYQWQ